jgi:hypothetical protein
MGAGNGPFSPRPAQLAAGTDARPSGSRGSAALSLSSQIAQLRGTIAESLAMKYRQNISTRRSPRCPRVNRLADRRRDRAIRRILASVALASLVIPTRTVATSSAKAGPVEGVVAGIVQLGTTPGEPGNAWAMFYAVTSSEATGEIWVRICTTSLECSDFSSPMNPDDLVFNYNATRRD